METRRFGEAVEIIIPPPKNAKARNPSVFPHFETDILLKFKLMAAWPGNLAVATISAVELRHRWGAGRLLSGQN